MHMGPCKNLVGKSLIALIYGQEITFLQQKSCCINQVSNPLFRFYETKLFVFFVIEFRSGPRRKPRINSVTPVHVNALTDAR